jgi:hypothetical protein
MIINTQLIKNPLNWLTVWAMVLLAGVLGHYIFTWAGVSHTPKPAQQ